MGGLLPRTVGLRARQSENYDRGRDSEMDREAIERKMDSTILLLLLVPPPPLPTLKIVKVMKKMLYFNSSNISSGGCLGP